MKPTVAISAIVTAFERREQTIETLRRIYQCIPAPADVIVHIDATDNSCETKIRREYPTARIINSDRRVGPGGARNKLIEASRHELVASFDDDSYPLDYDYFERAVSVCDRFPDASVVAAALYHRGDAIKQGDQSARWTADFCSGACIYRRSAFLQMNGYVPMAIAYGMEEVDLALRLHAAGRRILSTRWLRVFHDNDLRSHDDPAVTANSIANIALLAYLRYPAALWWIGFGQCLNRVLWSVRHGRWRGVIAGIMIIPKHLRAHECYKNRVRQEQVRSYLSLRRAPLTEAVRNL